jgi:hypothetical protein
VRDVRIARRRDLARTKPQPLKHGKCGRAEK